MVDRIGTPSPLAREAILAALKSQAQKATQVGDQSAAVTSPLKHPTPTKIDFENTLVDGLRSIQSEITAAEKLPEDILMGRVDDFHEIAIQLKRADITFKFAMEIRNKLIDAYREVMRMSV